MYVKQEKRLRTWISAGWAGLAQNGGQQNVLEAQGPLKCRQSPAAGICLQVSEPQSRVFMVRILIKTPGQKQQVLAVFLSVTEGIIIQNIRKNVDTGRRVRTEHLDDKSLAFRLSAISLAAQCRNRWRKEPEGLIMSCCLFVFFFIYILLSITSQGEGDEINQDFGE